MFECLPLKNHFYFQSKLQFFYCLTIKTRTRAFNLSIWKAEAGRCLESQPSQGYKICILIPKQAAKQNQKT